MTRIRRSVGCLLAIVLASWGLGSAAADPRGTPAPSRSDRPRVEVADAARMRGNRTMWSPAVEAAAANRAEQSAVVANEGGFLGLSGNGQISPADPTGAGAAVHVMTAVNVSYAIYPRATLTNPPAIVPPLLTGTLESLFPGLPAGAFVFDPKVVYDHYSGRFIMVFLSGHGQPFTPGPQSSRLLIASIPDATATDQSTWCLRDINADQIRRDGKQFGDYPGLGFDRNYVYVTTNQFDFGRTESFRYSQILAIGKQSLFSCSGKLRMTAFGKAETDHRSGDPAFTIQPAVTESELGFGNVEFMASFQESSCGFLCGRRLTIFRLKKKARGIDLAADQVNVPPGRMAPLGTQRDGSLKCEPIEHCWDAGDLRLVTAFYDADRDRLYTAHAIRFDVVPGDGYLEAAIRWYEIDPSPIKRARVTRSGIVGESGRDSGWPSVATDSSGNLFVNFNRAGAPVPGEYLSSAVATIPPGATAPSATLILVSGEALYVDETGRPQRWGDYTAINRDPLDPLDIWTINQYARTDGVPPSTNLWQQVVNRVSF
jgi:hypothetical protein